MAEIRITNCHVHTFTSAHAPAYFPVAPVVVFRWFPWLIRVLRFGAGFLPWEKIYDWLVRMEAFHASGNRKTQGDVLAELRRFYPSNSRFVVLPVDLELIGHGPVRSGIHAQHDELHALAQRFPQNVIPFATVFPDRPGAAEEFERCVNLGFRGLKLYPKTGFAPDHPVLMNRIYPMCVERNLPVMSHCSRGGAYAKGWTQARLDEVTAPDAFLPVMRAFPDLRVCLAHFGGLDDWQAYIDTGFDPEKPEEKEANWVHRIHSLITCGDWPNLYTDISYTLFKFDEFVPLLKLFLADPTVRERVLFGSDFYMTRQESLSEKALSIRLRDAVGEENFRMMAETNPARWLGEAV